jgi:hypothetical protein
MDENISCLIGFVLLCVFAVIGYYLARPVPRCPECDSKRVQEVSKEPMGLLDGGASVGAGGEGGGYGGAAVQYKITRKCVDCNAQWVKTETETG